MSLIVKHVVNLLGMHKSDLRIDLILRRIRETLHTLPKQPPLPDGGNSSQWEICRLWFLTS